MESILGIFLDEFGQVGIKDRIAYCMKELAVNAKKANTKRVYFKDNNLDITNESQYVEGMKSFKGDTLSNIDYYLKMQQEQGLYIKTVFHAKGNKFTLSIKNNTEISKKEQMRVYDRIARSRAFETMEEALTTVLDDSEGAGLGIVILVLMLKKLGLDEDAFNIDVEDGETIASITLPFSDIHVENIAKLSEEIVRDIEELPHFPENIIFLQKLINDPDSEITDIARQISMDASLIADLLKVVNSAQYMLPKRVDNIVEAVKMIGLRGLTNLLFSYGTQKLLDRKEKWLWDHSYKVAFYAYNIAKNFNRKNKNLLDDAYVGGILHDMGKIIFADIHPKLLEKINNFCVEKELQRNLFEDLSAGLNHAEIGGLVAEKWNFPQTLIDSIRYHHEPQQCPKESKDVVYTVYLANSIANIESDEMVYEQINREVLTNFGIKSEDQLMTILKRLSAAFSNQVSTKEKM
jgi:putative nucleotidyltransferase with HDIG domain